MFKLFPLGRFFFLLALFSAGASALPDLGSKNFGSRSFGSKNFGSLFTVRDVSRFPFRLPPGMCSVGPAVRG